MLSDEQIERYSRQIILPQVGGKGQEKLLQARILVSVSGPMQTLVLHYLAAAGVGTLGVFSHVQDAFLTAFVSSQEQSPFHVLTRLNPDCSVVLHSREEARVPQQLVQSYDLILSDTDGLHDACYLAQRPFLHASVHDTDAWLLTCRGFEPTAPCLRCLPMALPASSFASAFADLAAFFIGAHLVTEAIKDLLGWSRPFTTKLLRFHFPLFQCTEEIVEKFPSCSLCRLPLP